MPTEFGFSRTNANPATPVNGHGYFVKSGTRHRIKQGGPGGVLVDLDAPTYAEHALKADLSAVVQLANINQSIDGEKTFLKVVTVPTPTANGHATTKLYVDTADNALQNQINNLSTSIASGLKYKGNIDATANPNYPVAVVGDTYIVSNAGRIGGASGPEVEPGDTLICKANSAAGNHATVGANWTIIQNNMGYATEAVAGYILLASLTEVRAGANATKAVTPLGLETVLAEKAVLFDRAQTLTNAQKTQARNNIGAADASALTGYVPGTRQVLAGTGLSGGGPLSADVTLALNEVYTDNRYVKRDGSSTITGSLKVSTNNATTVADILVYTPTDYVAGKPRFAIAKTATANKYQIALWDGASSNGNINFVCTSLTLNDQPLLTSQGLVGYALESWVTNNFLAKSRGEYLVDEWI